MRSASVRKTRLRFHASKSSRTSSLSRHTADEKVTRCSCGPGHMRGKGAPTCCRNHSSFRLSYSPTFKVCILIVGLTRKEQILDTSLQTCSLLVSANHTAHSAHHLPERLACAGEHVGRPEEGVCRRVSASCCHHAPRLCISVTLRGMGGGR